jgi:hypothetical protein
MTDMRTLIWEVFERDGRREAELRLDAREKECLIREYGASCKEISPEDTQGKRWYLVRLW